MLMVKFLIEKRAIGGGLVRSTSFTEGIDAVRFRKLFSDDLSFEVLFVRFQLHDDLLCQGDRFAVVREFNRFQVLQCAVLEFDAFIQFCNLFSRFHDSFPCSCVTFISIFLIYTNSLK